MKVLLTLCLLLVIALPAQAQRNLAVEKSAPAERRVALVIGNGAYPSAPLKNPANDARDVAAALRRLGFAVIEKINVPQKEMNRAIAEFGDRLTADTVALFFYAGHGMQVKGKNYLLPIDARINSESSVRAEAVDVDAVLDQFAASPLNVVILDACRNNPFERKFRSTGGGLAQMDAPKGTLIAYATAPGKVASDGEGRNGLYTQELLKQLQTPELSVEAVFKRVRAGVARATGDAQIPWEASSLTGEFYFRPPRASAAVEAAPEAVAVHTPDQIEQQFWNRIRDSQEAVDFEDYLKQYPQGRFVAEARLMVRKLGGPPKLAVASPSLSPSASPSAPAPAPRAWIGVQIQELNAELAASFNLAEARGAIVVNTEIGGPAEKAGIEAGDVVVEFQGQAIQKVADLPPMVASGEPGTQVNVRVIRGGQTKDVVVTLGTPAEAAALKTAGKVGSDLEKFFGNFSGGVLFSQIKPAYQNKLAARGLVLLPADRITRLVRQGTMTRVKATADMDVWLAALDTNEDLALTVTREGAESFMAATKPTPATAPTAVSPAPTFAPAATPAAQARPAQEADATLCFFRTPKLVDIRVAVTVEVDRRKVGQLNESDAFCISQPAGTYAISGYHSGEHPKAISVTAQPGKTVYVKVVRSWYEWEVSLASEQDGQQEVAARRR